MSDEAEQLPDAGSPTKVDLGLALAAFAKLREARDRVDADRAAASGTRAEAEERYDHGREVGSSQERDLPGAKSGTWTPPTTPITLKRVEASLDVADDLADEIQDFLTFFRLELMPKLAKVYHPHDKIERVMDLLVDYHQTRRQR